METNKIKTLIIYEKRFNNFLQNCKLKPWLSIFFCIALLVKN